MSLIKSILLGSAAGIVAVAGAQAADLPTKKAAPVAQYVKICNVGGITGWTLPGSDTCLKISGYMTAQFTGGNLNTQYNWANVSQLSSLSLPVGGIPAVVALPSALTSVGGTQRVLVAASSAQNNTTFNRSETGWSARASLVFDFASNTAYGPLLGHIGIQDDMGNGFDSLTGAPEQNITYCDQCYLTWAGITAGKAASFYSFVGGGDNWANFLSPDQKGFNEPMLLAYTASFGGGFSATIAAQSPGTNGQSGGGTDFGGAVGPGTSITNTTFGGQKWPDIVGQLHVKQGWGEAQLSGVIHNVNVQATGLQGAAGVPTALGGTGGCGIAAIGTSVVCDSQETKIGWGIDAGVKINLPSFGQDDNFLITGAYSQSAVLYGGMSPGEMMWGEGGQVNGNGQPMYLANSFFNQLTNQWSTPRAWSVTALLEHHFTPQFYIDLEGSVGQIKWSNDGGGCNFALASCLLAQAAQGPISPSATTWIIGADLGWNPVTNLNFDLELMYQDTNQTRPSGFLGTVYNLGGPGGATFVPGAWEGNSSGFAGRFRITRYF